jgi:hypothetical protein
MGTQHNVPFLKRTGLTWARIAEVADSRQPRGGEEPEALSIRMLNEVKLSQCSRPSVPTARGHVELLRVELVGDLLSLAVVMGRKGKGRSDEALGVRRYAQKTVDMSDASAFMFLTEPPAGMTDEKFFPATGTAVLYDNDCCGPRVLKACGIDRNNGQCLSWIFRAVEI